MSTELFGQRCQLCNEIKKDIIYEDKSFICTDCIDDYREARDTPDLEMIWEDNAQWWHDR